LSPILVRPVREQLEHDRVIRLLQAKYKRKFDVAINPGNEQTMPVGTAPSQWYPDLVLLSTERSRKLLGVVEVETAESVNNLEAMSQWATFGRLRAWFHLYVPGTNIDTARRLCTDLQVPVAEIWAYHTVGDQIRFTLVQRDPSAETKPRAAAAESPRPRPTLPAASAPPRPAAASARAAAPRSKPAPARAAAPARPARRPAAAAAPARRKTAAKAAPAPARRTAAKTPARKVVPARSQKRK
jgi:pyruvate/2-oxoglutarate dehydrogenase complex dihydrolipoamide acyltransferase (E2) component